MFIIEALVYLILILVTVILVTDIVLPVIINKPFFWFTKLIIKGGTDKNLVVKQQEFQDTLVSKQIQELEKKISKLKKESIND